jgi:integrase
VLATHLERDVFTRPENFLFVGATGRYLDGSALRRRFRKAQRAAGLPPLRLHDLRHGFGSMAITVASPVEVQSWLGHSDVRTTARYLHFHRRRDEARRLEEAFGAAAPVVGLAFGDVASGDPRGEQATSKTDRPRAETDVG